MPKQKTRRAAAKRFKFTGTGKIKCRHAGGRHLLAAKSNKQKRAHGKSGLVKPADVARVKYMLPGR